MHFVLDLDHTLFNTAQHWADWLNRMEAFGIDRIEAVEAGKSLFDVGYTLRGHGELLPIPSEELDKMVAEFEQFTQKKAPELVYADVIPFLETHKGAHKFSILTFGHPEYQRFKIEWSGLDQHISDIRIAQPERSKATQLAEMRSEAKSPIIFVDDNPRELTSVTDAGLDISLVRMRRDGAPHAVEKIDAAGRWVDVTSLDELEW